MRTAIFRTVFFRCPRAFVTPQTTCPRRRSLDGTYFSLVKRKKGNWKCQEWSDFLAHGRHLPRQIVVEEKEPIEAEDLNVDSFKTTLDDLILGKFSVNDRTVPMPV